MKNGMKIAAATAAIGALGVMPSTASAIDVGDTVTGTTLGSLSLTVGTGAAFGTTLAPGTTPTATGALVATSTSPSWTLSVKDNVASGVAGTMDAAGGALCTDSAAELPNATNVAVTPTVPNVSITSAGEKAISGSSQTVASATGVLLAATAFTTSYNVVIPATTALKDGCIYSMTATYTLG